jgi:hypothetical protein
MFGVRQPICPRLLKLMFHQPMSSPQAPEYSAFSLPYRRISKVLDDEAVNVAEALELLVNRRSTPR